MAVNQLGRPAGAARGSAEPSAPATAEIARQRPAGAGGEAVSAPAAAAAPVLLSQATAERGRTILAGGTSPATSRAHAGDVAYFWARAGAELGLAESYPVPLAALVQFVVDHLEGLPPATEAALLERAAQGLPGGKARPGPHALATIARRIASLSKAHQLAGVPNPCQRPELRELLARAGRRQARSANSPRRKRAATREVLEALLATCDDTAAGVRDRALLLFAFGSGGRRRSEVAAARVQDLVAVDGGYLFHLRRSKTDQAGEGLELPVLGRAARALAAWLAAAGLTEGPVFCSLSWARRPRGGRAGPRRPRGGALRPQRPRNRQHPRRPGRLRSAGVRRPQPALRLRHRRRPPGH